MIDLQRKFFFEKIFLSLLDMLQVYQNQQPCDINLALNKLESICELQWKQTQYLKPKLHTYQSFKDDYVTAEYLYIFLIWYQRSLLAQFRIGILPFKVETGCFHTIINPVTGNYRHLRLHEHICQFCNMGSNEDECIKITEIICLTVLHVINYNEMSNNDNFKHINKNHQKGLGGISRYLFINAI